MLGPVLETLIENATRLCKAEKGFVFIREGEAYSVSVHHGALPDQVEFQRRGALHLNLLVKAFLP